MTIIGIPITLFVWLAMDGVVFSLLLWSNSGGLGGPLAKETLLIRLDLLGPSFALLPSKVKRMQETAIPAPNLDSCELEEKKTLRFVQHMIERSLTKHDDLSLHDVIERYSACSSAG